MLNCRKWETQKWYDDNATDVVYSKVMKTLENNLDLRSLGMDRFSVFFFSLNYV